MARLFHSPPGATLLPARPSVMPPAVSSRPRRNKPLALVRTADEPPPTHCGACKGENPDPTPRIRGRREALRWEPYCDHCRMMFGPNGQTRWPPDGVLERLRAVQESGFIIALRSLHLGSPDGGGLAIDMGDIFPVSHVAIDPDQLAGQVSKERTYKLFTLPLQIDRFQTRLFGHEFDGISLERVMAMRRAGEITESFVSCNDKVGHFTPRADIAELVASTFGARD